MPSLIAARPAQAILLSSLGLLLSACASSGAKLDATASATLPDATIAYTLAGHGEPTVVFQSGLGDGKDVWARVLPEAAKRHTVLAYDRPGYGASPKTTAPRDPCTVAEQQHQLLAKLGLKPPYVLVGNSLGGLYQYVYAKLYPQEVAGLVLLDPTHPDHWRRMQSDAPASAMAMKTMRTVMFNAAETAEFDAQAQCLERIDMRTPPRSPAMLLVRGKFGIDEMGSYETMVHAQENDWLSLSGAHTIERVTGAGATIQKDNPVIVNEAIKTVLKQK